jgi:hypothetical protein
MNPMRQSFHRGAAFRPQPGFSPAIARPGRGALCGPGAPLARAGLFGPPGLPPRTGRK